MKNTIKADYYTPTFYQKLGYLFYSIASADRRISPQELDALQQVIQEDWLNLDENTDTYGTDNAHQIQIIFHFLNEKDYNSESAYSIFNRYFKEHISLFTDDVIDRIFHSSNRIADSLNGRNKSELQALARLHMLLGKERHIV
jgi:hypothetical protein